MISDVVSLFATAHYLRSRLQLGSTAGSVAATVQPRRGRSMRTKDPLPRPRKLMEPQRLWIVSVRAAETTRDLKATAC